ncbi:MAG TPA: LEPR-XLL domain-containing protein, partial [Ilumatobacteraceae bacterium]|nr:LEPR-XLL domain-containing protein [Ilumatobacteraceae bacterium]
MRLLDRFALVGRRLVRLSHDPRKAVPPRRRLLFEPLEQRLLLSATLYVDFGDQFAGGVLNTTVGALDSTVSGSNPNIDGPVLSDATGADYGAAAPVSIQSFNSVYGANTVEAAADRAAITDLVERMYEPFDINVVQASAASLADISVTLGLTGTHDSYVIVGLFMINGTDNPVYFASNGYGGLATGTDIGSANNNDGTAFVLMRPFTDRYSEQFLGDQVVHESGHLFGLVHSFGNNPPSSPNVDEGLHQSDIMSYLGYTNFGGFNFITRYPMVEGNGNTDNDNLSAVGGALTPYDQLANDPNVGRSAFEYVTGTGQNDLITITKSGATTANVSVQACTNADFTGAIEVPGTAVAGTTYSYSIDLTRPLLIEGGARADRVVLDGDLGTTITLRGMHGTDEVVVMGKNAPSGSYVPGTNTANGLDGNADLRGSIVVGGTTINFQEFESAGSVTVRDLASFTFQTPLASDALTFDSVAAGQNRVTGTSGGVQIVPMSFFNVASLTLDTGTNDGGLGSDMVTFAGSGIVASGLQNLSVTTGTGNDVLVLDPASYVLPVGGGTFSFVGGAGIDEVRASADASFTLSDSSLAMIGGGSVALSSVERATLNGGAGDNSFTVGDWTGQATLRGAGGDDSYIVNFLGSGAGTVAILDTSGAADTLLARGTAVADTLALDATSAARGGESVSFSGVEALTVEAGGGDDAITLNGTGPATTVLGGSGQDDFVVNASGAGGATLDGEGDSDDYTVNFGALDGVVTVADTPPANVFDRLFVNGTALDEALLIAPAFVTRNGTETVNYSGIEALEVDAGDGDDQITVNGTGPATTVFGGGGDDAFTVAATGPAGLTLDGQEDSDSYAVQLGSLLGPVVISDTGTSGVDSLLINGTSGDDVIVLTDGGIDFGSEDVTFSGIEQFVVNAGDGDDVVDGSALTTPVTIFGGNGNDRLTGGSADDFLYGENGDDDLIGNLGADYLDGGAGSDAIVGDQGVIGPHELLDGTSQTTLAIPNGNLAVAVNVAGTVRRVVTLVDEQNGAADTLIGGDGDDYLHGGTGADSLDGGAGADALFGNDGDDVMAGGSGDDHLYGGAGNDRLDGNAGADIAYGGDGDDTLVADSSGDRLIDWFGNFNQFEWTGPGNGSPVIIRSPNPWVSDFVLRLAQADGAADPNAEIRLVVPGGPDQRGNSG